jgi:uncharacterized protein
MKEGADSLTQEGATEPRSAPLLPSERIDALDVLRGLALFGVLAINLVTAFRVSIFEQFLSEAGATSPLDRAVEAFLLLAVDMKAFAVFSLLFGVGLAIQFERLEGNPHRTLLLTRRLLVLLAIGLLHLFLIWNGDILTEYALAGFVVLPFLFGPRWLLAAAGLLFLGLYLAMPLLPPVVAFPDAGWMRQHVAEARQIYGSGTFSEILAFRIQEVPAILPLHIFVFPRTVALFLFGAFAWRTGILRRAAANKQLLFRIAAVGIAVGTGLTFATRSEVLSGLGPVLLALGYAAGIIAIVNLPRGRRVLAWAAPLGRMAFTNYLAQSVIFGWIFYGYGLGLFGRLGVAAALASGIAVYAAQAAFSTWWLRHYWYGPVEWLWRTLMYGVPQPMRAIASSARR